MLKGLENLFEKLVLLSMPQALGSTASSVEDFYSTSESIHEHSDDALQALEA